MEDTPQVVLPKSPLSSKTILGNLLIPIFTWLAVKKGINIPPETQDAVVWVLLGILLPLYNALIRFLTTGPISFKAPMRRQMTISLSPGENKITVVPTTPQPLAGVVVQVPDKAPQTLPF